MKTKKYEKYVGGGKLAILIWNWFEYQLTASDYPKHIFIDSESRVHHIEEGYITSEQINAKIEEMLDNFVGCLDTDGDSICDESDNCNNGSTDWTSTTVTDRDSDGCQDESEDDDDDNDNLIDCWNYWWSDGISLSDTEIQNLINSGECQDFALGIDYYPSSISILNNFPNPFNPSTEISFYLNNSGFITIDIYDLKGHKVENMVSEFYIRGQHELTWYPAEKYSSGVYIISLRTGESIINHKILYLK